ncbi:heat stress transcription factor B-2b-like isoform X2 [Rosa rugosa]|uniref:heat stress transcription factor B-2b-like isoform X2 n=1 Tax=Rosa rugosa TaxID=74645 RepID=UPI002B40EB52|nr:heat stress transcription factor B-2b-like isoform X2 [Rosa rugosa]
MVNSESEMEVDEIAQVLLQIQDEEVLPRQKFQAHAPPPEAPAHELEQFKRRLAGLDFPNKVYEVVDYPPLDYCIRWNTEGTGLQIVSDADFRKVALNLLCQGSFSSLTRQFQAYKNTKSRCKHEYSHEKGYFLRAQKQKLKKICRKPPQATGKTPGEGREDPLLNVEGRLTSLEAKMTCLQALSNVDQAWGMDQWLLVEGRQTSLEAKMTSLDANSDRMISEMVAIRQLVESRAHRLTPHGWLMVGT